MLKVGARFIVSVKEVSVETTLANAPRAEAIAVALPLTVFPNERGDKFYFEVPLHMPLDETATMNVKVDDIGYWPPGDAIAIFFGPTPLGIGSEPCPASEVNVVGRIMGDATVLKKVRGSSLFRLERVP